MKEDIEIIYNNFRIYHNKWGEYCVCRRLTGRMVVWNAGFLSLKTAKAFINAINPFELPKDEIEALAEKFHGRGTRNGEFYAKQKTSAKESNA